jgi:hypothetical protein
VTEPTENSGHCHHARRRDSDVEYDVPLNVVGLCIGSVFRFRFVTDPTLGAIAVEEVVAWLGAEEGAFGTVVAGDLEGKIEGLCKSCPPGIFGKEGCWAL